MASSINFVDVIHPRDAVLTHQLCNNKAMAPITGALSSVITKGQKTFFDIDYVKISEKNFPKVYEVIQAYSERVGISAPHVYLNPDRNVNAAAFGDKDNSYMFLNAGLLNHFSDDEVRFVVGHEIGHIACGHAPINTVANIVLNGADSAIDTIIVTKMPPQAKLAIVAARKALSLALLTWSRYAEISADRLGYLLCGDLKASRDALYKVELGVMDGSVADVDGYIEQHSKALANKFSKFYSFCTSLNSTHPRIVKRLIAISMYGENQVSGVLTREEIDSKITLAIAKSDLINSAGEVFEGILLKSVALVAAADNSIHVKESKFLDALADEYGVSAALRKEVDDFVVSGASIDDIDFAYEMTPSQRQIYLESLYAIAISDKKVTCNEEKLLTSLLEKFEYSPSDVAAIRTKLAKKFGLSADEVTVSS